MRFIVISWTENGEVNYSSHPVNTKEEIEEARSAMRQRGNRIALILDGTPTELPPLFLQA